MGKRHRGDQQDDLEIPSHCGSRPHYISPVPHVCFSAIPGPAEDERHANSKWVHSIDDDDLENDISENALATRSVFIIGPDNT